MEPALSSIAVENVGRSTPTILTLPTEIRLEIYRRYSSTCSSNIVVHQGKLFRSNEPQKDPSPLSLLLTCRTFAAEAANIVATATRFNFLVQDLYAASDMRRSWPLQWNYIPSSRSEAELETWRYCSNLRQLQSVDFMCPPSTSNFLQYIRHLDIRVLLNDTSCRLVDKDKAAEDLRRVLGSLNQKRPLESLNITLGFLSATSDVKSCDDPRISVINSLMELNKIKPKSRTDIVALQPTMTDSGEPSINNLAQLFGTALTEDMD